MALAGRREWTWKNSEARLGQKDINPDSSSKSSQTPLSLAAEQGHEGIVQLLLGRGDVNSMVQPSLAERHSRGLPKMGMTERGATRGPTFSTYPAIRSPFCVLEFVISSSGNRRLLVQVVSDEYGFCAGWSKLFSLS